VTHFPQVGEASIMILISQFANIRGRAKTRPQAPKSVVPARARYIGFTA
jgi:hypothetical protein